MKKEDWIILRLIYLGALGTDGKIRNSYDFVRAISYLMDKHGQTVVYAAIKDLQDERKAKEARAAQPRRACPHCGSQTQCR